MIYQGIYDFSLGMAGVAFVAILIACLLGAVVFAIVQWFVLEPYTLKHGIGVPETSLVPGFFFAAAAPIGLFIFASTARADIRWIVPTMGVVIYFTAQFNVSSRREGASDEYLSSSNTVMLSQLGCTLFIYLPTSFPCYAASLFAANSEYFPVSDNCQIAEYLPRCI